MRHPSSDIKMQNSNLGFQCLRINTFYVDTPSLLQKNKVLGE